MEIWGWVTSEYEKCACFDRISANFGKLIAGSGEEWGGSTETEAGKGELFAGSNLPKPLSGFPNSFGSETYSNGKLCFVAKLNFHLRLISRRATEKILS